VGPVTKVAELVLGSGRAWLAADATLGLAVANLVRTVGGLPTPELVP
jgi:hypothetical protein